MRASAERSSHHREEERKKKKKKKDTKKSKLSFAEDEPAEEEEDSERAPKRAKLGKNPDVNTEFLPDREREEAERREREELRQLWLVKQEAIKEENITIIFSYWDGSGHRNDVDVSSLSRFGEENCSHVQLLCTDRSRRATPLVSSWTKLVKWCQRSVPSASIISCTLYVLLHIPGS